MTSELCDSLTVVEFGSGSAAAALAGMLFADAGARVIKVESPSGDRMRREHPSGFLVWNRGKESLVLDLHEDDGRQLARDLVGGADVVIEGFCADTASRFGIAHESLRRENPGLVYCSVKGFSSASAYRLIKGYEQVITAKSGWMMPGTDGDHGYREGPVFSNTLMATVGCGNFAFAGSLAALIAREQTGRGQFLEATMVQGLTPGDYYGVHQWQWRRGLLNYGPARPRPQLAATADDTKSVGAARVYPFSRAAPTLCSKDGRWVNTTQLLQPQARGLLRALQMDDTLQDPRFAAAPYFETLDDADEYLTRLGDRFRERDLSDWMPRILAEDGVAFEPMVWPEDSFDHPQARHNGNSVVIEDPQLGSVEEIGPMAFYSNTPITISSSAPALGQHGVLPKPAADLTARDSMRHPLQGITIVECGFFYAMPFGVTLAASLGARVIKVEPLAGDPIRNAFGIWEGGGSRTMEGKESICLDLGKPEGQAILHRLIGDADLFVTSYRPSAGARLGVDYETLRLINPRLVYLHAPGYGLSGPYSERAMFAGTASALAGSFGRHAGAWLAPEMTEGMSALEAGIVVGPRLFAPIDGDSNQSLSIFSNILAALWHQRRSGLGQFVEATMMNGNMWASADHSVRYQGKPRVPQTDNEFYGLSALYRLYKAEQGWVFLAVTTDREWQTFVKSVDDVRLHEEAYETAEGRLAADESLAGVLSECFAQLPAADWESRLVSAGVACVKVFEASASEFTNTDPVMADAGLVQEVEHGLFGKMKRHGLPVQFSDTPGRLEPAATLGQHTRHILRTVGYSEDEISALEAEGAVKQSTLVKTD